MALVNIVQAAERLGVHRNTVSRMVNDGRLKSVVRGKRLMVDLPGSVPPVLMEDWLMLTAMCASLRSKDPSTRVGAVLSTQMGEVVATGYNGLHRGADDSMVGTMPREDKYALTVHAEVNAILNAARSGVSTIGLRLHVSSLPPCLNCSIMITQAGVKEVVYSDAEVPERWRESCSRGLAIMENAGIKIMSMPMPAWPQETM